MGFGVGEKADYNFDDVRFFDPTATGEQSTVVRRYTCDALGRRVSETTFENGVAATKYFVYDGNRIIEELDGNGNLVARPGSGPEKCPLERIAPPRGNGYNDDRQTASATVLGHLKLPRYLSKDGGRLRSRRS